MPRLRLAVAGPALVGMLRADAQDVVLGHSLNPETDRLARFLEVAGPVAVEMDLASHVMSDLATAHLADPVVADLAAHEVAVPAVPVGTDLDIPAVADLEHLPAKFPVVLAAAFAYLVAVDLAAALSAHHHPDSSADPGSALKSPQTPSSRSPPVHPLARPPCSPAPARA
jgi:hypothetical protein